MSALNFHSIGMAAGVAAAALGLYMVSLRVAGERATLEQVETRIVLAQRDIRLLQTEVGTRGRLAQLEKWNVKVLALSAPEANQFLQGSFQLATLVRPRDKIVDPGAPMVLASAPQPQRQVAPVQSDGMAARPGATPSDMMHVASYKASEPLPAPRKAVEKSVMKIATKAITVVRAAPVVASKPNAKSVDPLAPKPDSSALAKAKVGKSKVVKVALADAKVVKAKGAPAKTVARPAKTVSAPIPKTSKTTKDVKAKQ